MLLVDSQEAAGWIITAAIGLAIVTIVGLILYVVAHSFVIGVVRYWDEMLKAGLGLGIPAGLIAAAGQPSLKVAFLVFAGVGGVAAFVAAVGNGIND